MPRKKKNTKSDQPIHANPEALPEYVAPGVEEKHEEHAVILANFTKVETMDDVIGALHDVFALPNTGEQGILKAHGLFRVSKFLGVQRQRTLYLMGDVVASVRAASLWELMEDQGIASESDFWNQAGWPKTEIDDLIKFRHIVPLLEVAGLDPQTVYEATNPESRKVIRNTAQDVQRQIKNGTAINALSDTARDKIRETVLGLQDKPPDEVRRIQLAQRNKPTIMPIDIPLEIVVERGIVKVRIPQLDLDPEDIGDLSEGRAFLQYTFNNEKVSWVRLLERCQHALGESAVDEDFDSPFGDFEDDVA